VPRFRKEVVLNKPEDFVNFIIKDFMEKEGFKYTVYNGENVMAAWTRLGCQSAIYSKQLMSMEY